MPGLQAMAGIDDSSTGPIIAHVAQPTYAHVVQSNHGGSLSLCSTLHQSCPHTYSWAASS